MVHKKLAANPLRTKSDLANALREILTPLEKHMADSTYGLNFGGSGSIYNEKIREIEALLRPLWGIAPLLAGGGEYPFFEKYLDKIAAGTNPDSPTYWGDVGPFDQRMVEMAALALTLLLSPKHGHTNLYNWLSQINNHEMPTNNWHFFRILVNLALKKCGQPYSKTRLVSDLALMDSCYLGGGWYKDGEPSQMDYYIPFAMHFYGIIYAVTCPDCEYAPVFVSRAKEFAKTFAAYFDDDGAAVPFGRSMAYRFAQSGFWGVLAYANIEALPWGQVKYLAMQNLRHWFKQDIFTFSGELTVGYHYPNLVMGEGYNAFGSPYWALKAFIVLAVDDSHPFWQAKEEKPSVPSHLYIPEARSILQRDGNQVQLFPVGQHVVTNMVHTPAKYAKFVYSSAFGFSVQRAPVGLKQGAFDCTLAVSEQDEYFRMRDVVAAFEVVDGCGCIRVGDFSCEYEQGYLYSKWQPWADVTIESYIVPQFPAHVRIHVVDSKRPLTLADGGFAVDSERLCFSETENNRAILRSDIHVSEITCLTGNQKPEIIPLEPNTNLLYPRCFLPYLVSSHEPGKYIIASKVLGRVL